MTVKKIALVVPTIREDSFAQFEKRWADIGLFDHVHMYVMEDNPTKTFQVKTPNASHYSWEDIERDLPGQSWIIPRRSDTVRSYAYWRAWKDGFDFILTLDDDCYPCGESEGMTYTGEGFVANHLGQLTGRTRWFNTLNAVKPRGVPYFNLGKNGLVILNHGLWQNVLDYDGPTQLVAPAPEKWTFDSKIVPNGFYFPMCGMNVMWKAEATVLMYHLLMGQWVGKNKIDYVTHVEIGSGKKDDRSPLLSKLPFDRFGDIWCGIFMKKIADVCRLQVTSGMPHIRHERASNPFTNLKKEANGIEVNEKLWEYVDAWIPQASVGPDMTTTEMLAWFYKDLGVWIGNYNEFPEHRDYFRHLGDAMQSWASLFIPPVSHDEIPF